jgi:hypothetical protein
VSAGEANMAPALTFDVRIANPLSHMYHAFHILLFCLLMPLIAHAEQMSQTTEPGYWAAGATSLWPVELKDNDYPGRRISVPSPDGRFAILVVGIDLTVVRVSDGKTLDLLETQVLSLAEVLWSPDSMAFLLTESDGGAIGEWQVTAFKIAGNAISRFRLGAQARSHFMRKPWACEEDPNEYGVGWNRGSSEAQIIVGEPCHSSCKSMCRIQGYTIDTASGRVRHSLSEKEVRSRWSALLGPGFRGAK